MRGAHVLLIRASEFVSRMRQFVHLSEESFGQLVQFALADLIGLDRDVDVMPSLRQHGDAHRSEVPAVTPGAVAVLDLLQMQAKVPVRLRQDFVRRQLSAVKISHASRSGCWVETAESQAVRDHDPWRHGRCGRCDHRREQETCHRKQHARSQRYPHQMVEESKHQIRT